MSLEKQKMVDAYYSYAQEIKMYEEYQNKLEDTIEKLQSELKTNKQTVKLLNSQFRNLTASLINDLEEGVIDV